MLTVTKKAAALLKAAKAAEGATGGAGIRLRRGATPDDSVKLTVGFTISDEPDPDDVEFEQEGLRIFAMNASKPSKWDWFTFIELDGMPLDPSAARNSRKIAGCSTRACWKIRNFI